MDLRYLNTGRKTQYDAFWDECSKFLQEVVGTAVDDRRHTNVTHVATAISIRDFRDQVAQRCPDGTCIPSIEWIRLQFWPKLPRSKRALHHTGRFQIRFRVQERQFRKDHIMLRAYFDINVSMQLFFEITACLCVLMINTR